MKIETQTTAELRQLAELLEDFSVAMLTTQDSQGALTSRPMAPLEMDSYGVLWFFTDLNSAKVEQLRVANLAFVDPARSSYVSVVGHGEIDNNRENIERLWTPMARPWFADGPESTHLALLRFVPSRAEYWDAPNSKMVRLFALVASVVAGKPVGVGESVQLRSLAAS
jgi:general stress protein 26